MSSFAGMYNEAVQRYLQLKERKEERKGQLEAGLKATNWQQNSMGASFEHMLNGRLASDPLIKDLQITMDRTVAEATMYGLGAVIRNLAYLRGEPKIPAQREGD